MYYVIALKNNLTKIVQVYLHTESQLDKPGFSLLEYLGFSSEKEARKTLLKWRAKFKPLNLELDPNYMPKGSRSRK